MGHVSVLPVESIAALAIVPDGTYVDATYGAGGHTALMLAELSPAGRIVAFDADPGARERVLPDPRVTLVHANFRALRTELATRGISQIDGILFDLGTSSMQLDNAERGFSFREDAPLDMRLDPSHGETVAEFLAEREEKEIADAIFDYGDERAARRIARAIVMRRTSGRVPTTTTELASLVSGVVHRAGKRERTHPATRTFQALRIAVNDELGALRESLDAAMAVVRPEGRIAVISFHSLEDRIVKTTFRDDPRVGRITRKPIIPTDEETASNPRSRSAKLRVAAVVAQESAE